MNKRLLVCIGLGLFLSGLLLGLWRNESEYYRGGYDTCLVLTPWGWPEWGEEQVQAYCLYQADWQRGGNWHRQPSRGWQWPLPGE